MRKISFFKNKLDVFLFAFSAILLLSTFLSVTESKAEVDYPTVLLTVEEGDSLWTIAKKNMLDEKMTVQEMVNMIQLINDLDEPTIYPGQQLHIPVQVEMEISS